MGRHDQIRIGIIFVIVFSAVRVTSQDVDNANATVIDTPEESTIMDWDNRNENNTTSSGNVTSAIEDRKDENMTSLSTTPVPDDEDVSTSLNTTSSHTSSAFVQGTTRPTTPMPCDRSFCNSNGECLSSKGESSTDVAFHCLCDAGYVGKRCEIQDLCTEDAFQEVLCRDGACVYTEDMTSRYCGCFYGEFWDAHEERCRRPDPPCFPNPCKHGGTCKVTSPEKFNCTCRSNYTGPTCNVAKNCGKTDDGAECGNGVCKFNEMNNEYSCECFEGYYSHPETRTCKRMNPPCEPDPCSGHGTCKAGSSNDTFNCTCNENYTGERCQLFDRCSVDENGNRCLNGQCKITDDVQFCVCDDGYSLDVTRGICVANQPPCVPNPCENGGHCNAISEEEFNCSCSEGFTGEMCSHRNRCVLDGGEAFCDEATCVMDYEDDAFYCACGEKKYFDYRARECKGVDLCPLLTCEENEICKDGSCICADGFKEDDNGDCKADFCSKYGCPSDDMLCEESSTGRPEDFKCSCRPTYSFNGTHCVPAVCRFPKFNNCSQICTESTDGFRCDCEASFHLNNDSSSCDNDGATKCENSTCSPGVCVVVEESKICVCPPGYVEQEGRCMDVCSAGKLPPGICPDDKCVPNESKGFQCQCDGKYELSDDGVTCTVRKMCRPGEAGWDQCTPKEAECVDDWTSEKGYECRCPPGFEEIMKYGKCERICENPANQKACLKLGAVCDVDRSRGNICRCPPAFRSSVDGGPCTKLAEVSYVTELPISIERYRKTRSRRVTSLEESDIDMKKLEADISEAMKNIYEAFTAVNILKCESPASGMMLCKVELQFEEAIDERTSSRIQAPSSFVYNETISREYVLLPPSLVLAGHEVLYQISFARTSLCDEDIKEQMCGSETECTEFSGVRGFTCTCGKGFRLRQRVYPTDDYGTFVETCNDIDECLESKVCPLHSKCTNTIGSYTCSCLPGYRYANESSADKDIKCIALCDPSPCMHGECVKSGDHNFECKCKAGYGGSLCDFEDKNYKAANAKTIIVGAVLGGVLLITVILFASTVSRIRKKKHMVDPSQILYCAEMTDRLPSRMGATNTAYDNRD